MQAFILIKRYHPSNFFWPNLVKHNKIKELSVEQILNKYQGFEGELIVQFPIGNDELGKNNCLEKCAKINKTNSYIVLFVSNIESIPVSIEEKTFRMGFDVGVCEEEATIYSSIFNEILFGHLEELIAYKDFLNENFLFSDKSLAEKYLLFHDKLSSEGKGVEDYEKMTIYEIRKEKN
jgi:hypothetical protein